MNMITKTQLLIDNPNVVKIIKSGFDEEKTKVM